MKILLLANHMNYGGISVYCYNLGKILVQTKKAQVFIASRGGDLVGKLELAGIRHIDVPLSTKCEVSPKILVSFLKLLPLIRSENIDVIHAHTRVTQVLAVLLSAATKKPFISTCHGFFKKRFFRRMFPCWGAKVIAISEPVKEHLIDDFNVEASRIDLVYNGIDLDDFLMHPPHEIEALKKEFGLDPSKKIIGHIGRLSYVKGQEYFIEAAAVILKTRRDVQFFILGDGPEEKALRSIIKKRNMMESFFIFSSDKKRSAILSMMDVFVMPSRQEGLGISLLEASAVGIPVAAFRVGGILSVVEDGRTGLLAKPQDASSLAQQICKLLDDATLAKLLSKQAKEAVYNKFSIEKMAKGTYQAYCSLS